MASILLAALLSSSLLLSPSARSLGTLTTPPRAATASIVSPSTHEPPASISTPTPTRRALLQLVVAVVGSTTTTCAWPRAAAASNAGTLAAKARAAEREQNEAIAAAPINQLQRALSALDAADGMLGAAADGGMTAAKWGDFRELIAPGMTSVRIYCPKKGALGELRAAYLGAAKEVDQFAYDQQLRNLREKYPEGYQQFKERNLNVDVSEPSAALKRAKGALNGLLASAREEEWGSVVVSVARCSEFGCYR